MNNLDSDIKFALALNQFEKFGPVRFARLRDFFPSFEAAFRASLAALISAGIETGIAQEFLALRDTLEPDKMLATLEQEAAGVLLSSDEAYPKRLKEIHSAPALLYYRGLLPTEAAVAVAVVGARKYSAYGKQVAEELAAELARSGLAIVSGLALGIDALAHAAAIDAGGRTIAVLGSGLDRKSVYPSSNRYLADRIIAEGGLILSEFPLGTMPLKHHFPQRNRIISGLSVGTLVIEAGLQSGSLITAKCALEQNREVFAVPGSIYSPLSAGTNWLLSQGAIAVTKAGDITDALDISDLYHYIEKKKIEPASPEEGQILPFLSKEPLHINEVTKLSGLPAATVSSSLVMLEMKGAVKNLGGMMYILK